MKFVLPCVKLTNKAFKPSPATHNSSCFRNLQILNTNSHLEQQAQPFSLSSDTFTQYNCVVHTFRKLQSCCIVQVHGSPWQPVGGTVTPTLSCETLRGVGRGGGGGGGV